MARIALVFAISIQIIAAATTLQEAKEQARLEVFKVTTGGEMPGTDESVDDSNWMAIVDLVRAANLQLLYTTDLQTQFDQYADTFFTGLEDLAESAVDDTSVTSAAEASNIRELVNTFISNIRSVLDAFKLKVKELLIQEQNEKKSGVWDQEEDQDDETDEESAVNSEAETEQAADAQDEEVDENDSKTALAQ